MASDDGKGGGKPAEGDDKDPYGDWSDEDRAEWDAGEKFRKRHADEVAGAIFEKLFGTPEGGENTDPDGKGEEEPPSSGGAGGGSSSSSSSREPWFERRLFARKAKPAEAKK